MGQVRKLAVIFIWMSMALTAYGQGTPLQPTEAWYQKQTQILHMVLGQFVDLIAKNEPQLRLMFKDGSEMNLVQLKRQMLTIDYRPGSWMKVTNLPADVRCATRYHSQWLMAVESPTGRPLIIKTNNGNLGDFDHDELRLLFHEAVSAIGIVDDEYQVSGPLLNLMAGHLPRSSRISSRELLVGIERRYKTPRYSVREAGVCYRWEGSRGHLLTDNDLAALNRRGTLTGVGGGGNSWSPFLKQQLIAAAVQHWREKDPGSRRALMAQLNRFGLDAFEQGSLASLGGMDFRKSKITGQWTLFTHDHADKNQYAHLISRRLIKMAEILVAADSKGSCFDEVVFDLSHARFTDRFTDAEADRLQKIHGFRGDPAFFFKKGRRVECQASRN